MKKIKLRKSILKVLETCVGMTGCMSAIMCVASIVGMIERWKCDNILVTIVSVIICLLSIPLMDMVTKISEQRWAKMSKEDIVALATDPCKHCKCYRGKNEKCNGKCEMGIADWLSEVE